jgi:NADH-quinone oxidoreductase subunit L
MNLVHAPFLCLIVLLPLVGAAYAGLFGARLQHRFGERAVHVPTVALPWLSFLVALVSFVTLASSGPEAAVHQRLWTWFSAGSLKVDIAFLMDRLSGVMCLVVTFVGSLIHVYSIGYMRSDPSYWRFFAYLNLFMFSMLVLVLGDSLLLAFVGWEGVGLCSYLLIGFWYTDASKAAAGMKAFVVNRIGDAGFLLGVLLLFWGLGRTPQQDAAAAAIDAKPHAAAQMQAGRAHHDVAPLPNRSVTFREIESILEDPVRGPQVAGREWSGVSILTLAALLLFLGAMGKSAQIPLYVWLPDAMAGPTPVSALIHAATMVTAGVYLVARMHFVFAASPVAITVVTMVGAVTALFAATIGLFQHDIKKVLAYSTVSQLGFMFVAVGVGAYWVGIFHLVTHAFFKACLFLASGSVIVGCHHEQDMRRMGGLRRLMPVTAITYFVACFAIAGFPPLSGFFSKDEILWRAFNSGNLILPGGGLIPWALITAAAFCTSFYMFRSYYMTFSGEYRGHGHGHADHEGHGGVPHESPRVMTGVLAVLAGLAAVAGFMGLPTLFKLPNVFEHWLEPVFESSSHRITSAGFGHGWEGALMFFSVAIAVAGFVLARWLYRDGTNPIPARLLASPNRLVRNAYRVVLNKYYVDELYDGTAVRGVIGASAGLSTFDSRVIDELVNIAGQAGKVFGQLNGLIDRWLVDGLVNLVGAAVIRAGRALRVIQTGYIQSYVYGALAGSVFLLILAFVAPW